ncbi:hypothetical protein FRC09_000835 [Ceratobasidium sp. 395]|nr:hypothetical protein FRC09_000835 [Ceratobasidium sp. 395]
MVPQVVPRVASRYDTPELEDLIHPLNRFVESLSDVIQALATRGCPDITPELAPDQFSQYPVYSGGFGEIYSGQMRDGTKVAVKRARYHVEDDREGHNMRLIAREIHAWAKCHHDNVLELLGLTQHRGKLAVVAPWMENGNLRQYLGKNPDVDRLDLVQCA